MHGWKGTLTCPMVGEKSLHGGAAIGCGDLGTALQVSGGSIALGGPGSIAIPMAGDGSIGERALHGLVLVAPEALAGRMTMCKLSKIPSQR